MVTVLIDGVDVLKGPSATRDFIGFHPDQILGPESPLLPKQPPRRVAVYCCNCGEAGCGVVAPMIAKDGASIAWYDFRDFTGVYGTPVLDEPMDVEEEGSGTLLEIEPITFRPAQYRAEVARASDAWTMQSARL